MAGSRQTVQQSDLSAKDLEANLLNPSTRKFTHVTTVRSNGAAARVLSYVGGLDEMCFCFALCGFWSQTFLNGLLVLLYTMQSATRYDAICWSLAAMFWGIVALSVHSMQRACRISKSDHNPSGAHSLRTQTRIAEALILTAIVAWYRNAIIQKMSPYNDLFSICSSAANWEVGYTSAYYFGSLHCGIAFSQCDLATAIANVTWVGPIALLLATWTMLIKWVISPTRTSGFLVNAKESGPALKNVLFPNLHREIDKELGHKPTSSKDAFLADQTTHS